MGSRITVRYFQVVLPDRANRQFSVALHDASQIGLVDRKKAVDGTNFRLERHENRNGYIRGEMTRIQNDNLPAEVTDAGLDPLDVDELGFGAAFVFEPQLSVLAIQYDPRLVTPGRLGQYLQELDARNKFLFRPIPGPNAWQLFQDNDVKSFKVKMAMPSNFDANVGVADDMADSINTMAQAYQAPYITVTVGVGNRKITLSHAIKDTANRLLGRAPVDSMRAKVTGSSEEIDLMEEMLHDRDEITVDADPGRSYQTRAAYVLSKFQRRVDYLEGYLNT
ncbi:MAG: DUF6731 family protein [Pseudohongiellaceae bacterium]